MSKRLNETQLTVLSIVMEAPLGDGLTVQMNGENRVFFYDGYRVHPQVHNSLVYLWRHEYIEEDADNPGTVVATLKGVRSHLDGLA
jgi:hypothetical protein